MRSGSCTGVVGPSGSGKSTLARLIAGLVLPETGAIFIDGIDIRNADPSHLRRVVGYLPQSAYLFEGSVRENILMARPKATSQEIERVAKIACVHDEIIAFPSGYDYRIEAGGSNISGGQRQRIALAQALIREPQLLVLDEGTSHLDALTEATIIDNLNELKMTVAWITHRAACLEQADNVIVLERGHLVEQGTHDQLRSGGTLYSRICYGAVAE